MQPYLLAAPCVRNAEQTFIDDTVSFQRLSNAAGGTLVDIGDQNRTAFSTGQMVAPWAVALSAQPKHCGTITFHLYRRASLPVSKNTGFNVLFRQYAAVSPLRRCIAVMISTGILTCLPSGSPLGLPLGSDLPPDD